MVNVQGWLGKGSPEGRSFQAACRELDRARCAPTDQTARGGGESATPGKTTGERVGRTGKSRTDPTAAGPCFRQPEMAAPAAFAFCKVKQVPPHPQEERKNGGTICPATETGFLCTGRTFRITMECAEIRLRYISEMSFAKLVCDAPYFLTYCYMDLG